MDSDHLHASTNGRATGANTSFGAPTDFESVIDSKNWHSPGEYYQTMPVVARAAVSMVVADDKRLRSELRHAYLPELLRTGGIQRWERADWAYIDALQRKVLYTGRAVAADGTLARYATLSLVGAQIAVSKVSYQGDSGHLVTNIMHWGAQLPRKTTAADIAHAIRSRAGAVRDSLENVYLYAIMTYKEREILLSSPPGTFKLIQGPIFPHEMLSGAGKRRVMTKSLELIGRLIDDGAYACIISSSANVELLDLGMALDAGEYLVVGSGADVLAEFKETAHYSNQPIEEYGFRSQIEIFDEFASTYGQRVVQGVLRAHTMSRPYVFFCNADRVEEAVHMLLADAANTGPRGFPLLLDLADQHCSGSFQASEYTERLNAEFTRASGGSVMYQAERSSRD